MIWRKFKNKFIAQTADYFTVIFSFYLGYFIWVLLQIKYPTFFGHFFKVGYFGTLFVFFYSIIWVFLFNANSAYNYQRFTSLYKEFSRVVKVSILGMLGIIALLFLFRIKYVPRTLMVIIFIVVTFMLLIEKLVLFYLARIIRKKGRDRKKILIVGTGKRAYELINTINRHFDWGLDIIGIISSDTGKVGMNYYGYNVLATIKEIREILHKYIINEVIITISTRLFNKIRQVIAICEEEGVQVRINSDFFGSLKKRLRIDHVYGLPIISILQVPADNLEMFLKRIIDILFSSILIILLFPLMSVIALLIKLTSEGPILYEWNVVGLDKKPFKSWKFRSMVLDADKLRDQLMSKNEMSGPVFKIKKDPRVTPIGRFIRKYSIDELPQLYSVLKGDLSLVGPRPAGPHELNRYDNWHRRKLSIKPGITCLWQVNGRNEINNFDDWVKMDLYYIDNWSIWLDFKILLKTALVVVSGKGAS